ncbi:MAG TPA: hypothetical protein VEC39_07780, partial [Vicinamibacterales bacterium]|nr:hypothetical protein [Vicinamibacterales bacterium]
LQRVGTVGCDVNLATEELEVQLERFGNRRIIFGKQYSGLRHDEECGVAEEAIAIDHARDMTTAREM